jgi:hypothetical protein
MMAVKRFSKSAVLLAAFLALLIFAWLVLRLTSVPVRSFDRQALFRRSLFAPQLPRDDVIKRGAHRAEIDHFINPTEATHWPHFLSFQGAYSTPDGDLDFIFTPPGTADVLVIYRYDRAHRRFKWKMPVYTEA